jgi:hypothetical protein
MLDLHIITPQSHAVPVLRVEGNARICGGLGMAADYFLFFSIVAHKPVAHNPMLPLSLPSTVKLSQALHMPRGCLASNYFSSGSSSPVSVLHFAVIADDHICSSLLSLYLLGSHFR